MRASPRTSRSLSWCLASRARCLDGSIICSQSARTLFYSEHVGLLLSSEVEREEQLSTNSILDIPLVGALPGSKAVGRRPLLIGLLDI